MLDMPTTVSWTAATVAAAVLPHGAPPSVHAVMVYPVKPAHPVPRAETEAVTGMPVAAAAFSRGAYDKIPLD